MADAVEDDLDNGALTGRVIARLIIGGCGEAVGRAREIVGGARRPERSRGRVGLGGEGHGRVERARGIGVESAHLDRLDGRQFGGGDHAAGDRHQQLIGRMASGAEADHRRRHQDRDGADQRRDYAQSAANRRRSRSATRQATHPGVGREIQQIVSRGGRGVAADVRRHQASGRKSGTDRYRSPVS